MKNLNDTTTYNYPVDIKKFAISMGFLTMVLTACGKNVVDTTQTNLNPTQTVETQVTPVEEDPEVTIPVVEPTDPVDDPVVEPVVEDKYPDATIEKTGDNSYVMHIDCPDNSAAEIIAQTANIRNFYEYSVCAESMGISENLTTAIATYGMQINPDNVYQINYTAYMDKPFTFIAPDLVYLGSDPHATSVITNNPGAYHDIKTYSERPNDSILAGVLLRSCLDNTQNVSLALLEYFAGPDEYNQIITAAMNDMGCTYEEICANYDARYVLQYDIEGLVDDSFINGILQYIASDDPIVIKYYDDNGKLARTDTYHIVRI